MAEITNIAEVDLNDFEEITWTDGAAGGQTFEFDVADERLLLLLWNDGTNETNNITVTIEAGDMWQEAYGDITVDLDQNEFYVAHFDSAVVKDEDGEVTIDVQDTDPTDIQIAIVKQSYSMP